MPLSIVILAAGQGTRMHSRLPKVLQRVAGRPLLGHVIDAAERVEADAIHVVYGFGGDVVREALSERNVSWHEQAEQLGTGHAVMQAMPAIPGDHTVLVLYGDVPLIRSQTLAGLVDAAGADRLGLLTVSMDNPTGYGRIVRDAAGAVQCIVEQRDATREQGAIREINTGLIACPAHLLAGWLDRLSNENSQGEYYLTDVVGFAVGDGVPVHTVSAPTVAETLGINDKIQLAEAEKALRERNAQKLLEAGVTLIDPARIDVRGHLECGQDVEIDVNVVFEGNVKLADGVRIGPNCHIRDTEIEDDTQVFANCVIEEAHFGPRCLIGPFARVRPATFLGSQVKLGNFVEVKKSTIAKGSKVNHLSYVGDTTMGQGVNVGAGTITCNYDGANKHQTVIEDGVFIGSGTQLVAPVTLGEGATIGAGSVISREAPAGKLTVARSRQHTIEGWKKPVKKPKS